MKRKIILFLILVMTVCIAVISVSCKKHTEHVYGEWSITREATCTSKGERERVCGECGQKQTEEISMSEHSIEEYDITKQPDCVTAGEKIGVCSLCGQTVKVTVQALGHNPVDGYVSGDETHWRKCSRCSVKLDESAHALKDGVCQTCGWTEEVLAELTFELLPDGTYVVTGYSNAEANAVEIPATYQNVAVTAVAARAFYNKSNIKRITLAEGIIALKEYCFAKTGIESLVVPASVTECAKGAFQQCPDLEKVVWGVGLPVIAEQTFWQCINLKRIDIPDSVTSIETYALMETGIEVLTIKSPTIKFCQYSVCKAENLREIVFEEGVEKIDSVTLSYNFSECPNLSVIKIPSTVTSIYKFFFNQADSLQTIDVSESNETYSSLSGILYNKERTSFIKVPSGIKGVIDIPEGITGIPAETFWYCSDITEINLPSTVKSVGQSAFAGTNITSMTFPDSVKTIGGAVFGRCTKLKTVYIGSGVTSINGTYNMFRNCESVLESIIVSEQNENFKSVNNAILSKDGTRLYRANAQGEIPEGVSIIEDYAFENNAALTSLKIPEGVLYIFRGAFSNCINLTKIELPQTLKTIAAYVFENTSIKDIVIPQNVFNISCWAFDECKKLEDVVFQDTGNWKVIKNGASSTTAVAVDVTDSKTNAENFLGQYYGYQWNKG